jgi:hypothetical protein
MPQTTLDAHYLHAFNAHSGLWESVMLGSPVSPLSLEAMSTILLKDGTLAYIGSREEFGDYLQNLQTRPGESSSHSLISCQGHTVRARLGLCRYMDELGRSLLIFYGSPLTWTLTVYLACQQQGWETALSPYWREGIDCSATNKMWQDHYTLPHESEVCGYQLCNDGELVITRNELREVSSIMEGI